MNLSGSLIVVTGAASGLGYAATQHFVSHGAKVAMVDMNESKLSISAHDFGDNVKIFALDVTDETKAVQAISEMVAWAGEIRGLLNCAGIGHPQKIVGRNGALNLTRFKTVVDVNLIGTVNMMRLVAESMIDNSLDRDGERGAIVNTASIAAYEGQVGQTSYAASKGGIVAMTLPAARDLARSAIRVNTIAPGIMETPLLIEAGEKVLEPLLAVTQFPQRLGRPEEFADAVRFLFTNTYMNGAVLRLDGAIRLP